MIGAILGAWVLMSSTVSSGGPVYFNSQAHCEAAKASRWEGKYQVCVPTGFPEVKVPASAWAGE